MGREERGRGEEEGVRGREGRGTLSDILICRWLSGHVHVVCLIVLETWIKMMSH